MRDRGFAFWFLILVGLVTLALFVGGGFYLAQQQGAIDLSGAPDMVTTMTAEPTSVQAGGKLTYAVTYTNAGESTAGSVALTVNLPQNVAVDAIVPSAACRQSDTIVTCNLGSRSGGSTGQVTIETTVGSVASGTALAANASLTVETTRDLKRAEGDSTNNSASASATVQ